MGCGSSKEEAYNGAQAKPEMYNGAVPPQAGYAAPAPPQYQKSTRKQKAVKAGTNMGFLGIMFGS
jgi:hypothetical protein